MDRVRKAPLWVKIVVPVVLVLAVIASVTGDNKNTENAANETPAGEEASPPPPPPPADQARETVRAYYHLVNARQYGQAWNRLSPDLKASLGGFDKWRDGYQYTSRTRLARLDTVSARPGEVVLAIKLVGVSRDACDDRVKQVFEGTWTLNKLGGRFVGTSLDVAQTGGGVVVFEPSSCAPQPTEQAQPTEPQPAPPLASECNPNYAGACLDQSGDYDCAGGSGDGPNFTETVQVVGSDPYGLDADGDGVGCE
jgi:hypothetical protein